MEDLTTSEHEVLEKFYEKLYNETERQGKLERNSVFISFTRPRKSTIYGLLQDASISEDYLEGYIIESLKEKGYITETDRTNMYSIKSKGVWKMEREKDRLPDSKIIEHFEEEYFDQFDYSDKSLHPKRKTLLLALIAGRPFSKDLAVDLKNDDVVDKWKEVIDRSFDLLKELEIIGDKIEDQEELYGGGNLPPVAGLFQRGELNKKTKKIFKSKNGQYYLDVSDGGELDEKKLEFLLEKVVGDKQLELDQLKRLNQFCADISNNESIYLYESNSTKFSSPEYDDVLWNVIMSL